MNTIWFIDEVDTWNKTYTCFPMYNEDQEHAILDKWFVGYGDQTMQIVLSSP